MSGPVNAILIPEFGLVKSQLILRGTRHGCLGLGLGMGCARVTCLSREVWFVDIYQLVLLKAMTAESWDDDFDFQSSPTRHSVGASTDTEEDWDMDNDDDDDQDRTLTTPCPPLTTPRPPLTTNPQSPTTSVFSTDTTSLRSTVPLSSTPTPPLHREPRRLRKRSRPLAQLPDDTNTPQKVHEPPTPSPQPPPDSSGFLSSGIGSVKRWSSRRKKKTSMPSDVTKDQGAQGGWSCLFRSF